MKHRPQWLIWMPCGSSLAAGIPSPAVQVCSLDGDPLASGFDSPSAEQEFIDGHRVLAARLRREAPNSLLFDMGVGRVAKADCRGVARQHQTWAAKECRARGGRGPLGVGSVADEDAVFAKSALGPG
jgi:hypothetical protein